MANRRAILVTIEHGGKHPAGDPGLPFDRAYRSVGAISPPGVAAKSIKRADLAAECRGGPFHLELGRAVHGGLPAMVRAAQPLDVAAAGMGQRAYGGTHLY